MKFLLYVLASFLMCGPLFAQASKKTDIPAAVPVKPGTERAMVDRGTVSGRTYSNAMLGFSVTFPDTWLIPGDDFEAYMKSQGFDLSLKAPDSLPAATKKRVDRAIKQVEILLTAYRSMPGMSDNAIARISLEDIRAHAQVRDAVDYFDAIRAMYASMRLPADFKYSETGAERLGRMQFAYLDTWSKAGKKRMYATVRKGYAIQFTLSYTKAEDLATFRKVLETGKF